MVITDRLNEIKNALDKNNVFEIRELVEDHLDRLELELTYTRSELNIMTMTKSDNVIKLLLLMCLIGFIFGAIFGMVMPPLSLEF